MKLNYFFHFFHFLILFYNLINQNLLAIITFVFAVIEVSNFLIDLLSSFVLQTKLSILSTLLTLFCNKLFCFFNSSNSILIFIASFLFSFY